jgi:hypothetical protein
MVAEATLLLAHRVRRGKLTPVDVLIAVGAFALTGWGSYPGFVHPVST